MFFSLFILSLLLLSPIHSAPAPDSVLLKDVQALTLHHDARTTGRRSSPVPQLTCVGGTGQSERARVQIVQCKNKGFDGHDYQWECVTQIPETLRLGKIEVSCEGYSYPDDPYILKGSCGLEYRLEYTDLYYKQQQHQKQQTTTPPPPIIIQKHEPQRQVPREKTNESEFSMGTLIILGFFVVAMFLLVALCFTDCTTAADRLPTLKPYPSSMSSYSPPPPTSSHNAIRTERNNVVIHNEYTHYVAPRSTVIMTSASNQCASIPYYPTPLLPVYTPTHVASSCSIIPTPEPEPTLKESVSYGGTKRREESDTGKKSSSKTESSWWSSSLSPSTSSHSSSTNSSSTSFGTTKRR